MKSFIFLTFAIAALICGDNAAPTTAATETKAAATEAGQTGKARESTAAVKTLEVTSKEDGEGKKGKMPPLKFKLPPNFHLDKAYMEHPFGFFKLVKSDKKEELRLIFQDKKSTKDEKKEKLEKYKSTLGKDKHEAFDRLIDHFKQVEKRRKELQSKLSEDAKKAVEKIDEMKKIQDAFVGALTPEVKLEVFNYYDSLITKFVGHHHGSKKLKKEIEPSDIVGTKKMKLFKLKLVGLKGAKKSLEKKLSTGGASETATGALATATASVTKAPVAAA